MTAREMFRILAFRELLREFARRDRQQYLELFAERNR